MALLPAPVELLLVVAAGLLPGRWFSVHGVRRALPRSILLPLGILALAITLLVTVHVWFAWLIIPLVQFPCAMVIAVIAPRRKLDAFISYRRRDAGFALWLQSELARNNRYCFLDVAELSTGDLFRAELKDAIAEAPVFIALISEGTLDGCWKEDDMMTQEIIEAHERRKRIVPVLLNGFSLTRYAFDTPPAANPTSGKQQRQRLPNAIYGLKDCERVEHSDKAATQTVTKLLHAFRDIPR